jgi:hypothetical protein
MMLRGSGDGLVDCPLVGRRVQELAAQVLQQAQRPGGHCEARQPRLARSSTAHTSDRHERSPGSRPMTFIRRSKAPVSPGAPSLIPVAAPAGHAR